MPTTRLDLIRSIANEIAGEDHGLAVSAVCGVLLGLLSPLDRETRAKLLDETPFGMALEVLIRSGMTGTGFSDVMFDEHAVSLNANREQSH